ncbi:type II toxin-antitoxin system MqsR family toxin [Candidatus Albibeggiatoa sp. nov. BB20]|uniref:type II toxin-antitoxin system MqsR family toxin n=1 Tax=Candidatus Albibeggiatoa sp. nov. BB20 TaxID=3162723 RepID=UPI00336572CE
MTRTARRYITELNIDLEDVIFIIQSIKRQYFYKSMTTYADHKIWQDVYHYQYNDIVFYIKFMADDDGHIIVLFKEK